jgi:hypothetical protein
MFHRNCCRTRITRRIQILAQAARSALTEPLESRLHLSYNNRGTISVIVDETKAASLSRRSSRNTSRT